MRCKILFLVVALSAFALSRQTVSSQSDAENRHAGNGDAKISVRAEGQGKGLVNFGDGADLHVAGDGENQSAGAPLRVLASADFDSDGVPDLIAADAGGALKIYRGNGDSIFTNSALANANRARGAFDGQAFFAAQTVGNFTFAPDFLFAGDFNADGFSDVLAARRGDNFLHLAAGDGRGNFAADFAVNVGGAITAIETGEIGRADGQTDVAVALAPDGKNAARLLIYEHPEGAFKHKPEITNAAAAVTNLAIGELDGDSYGDVAAAGGNLLTVVHGRGQAYPLVLLEDAHIERPAAKTESAKLNFYAAALAIGRFTERRGQSLAVLTIGGAIQILETPENTAAKRKLSTEVPRGKANAPVFAPGFSGNNANRNRFASIADRLPQNEEEATARGLVMADSSLNGEKLQKYLREKAEQAAAEFAELPKKERERQTAEKAAAGEKRRAGAKAAFEHSLSAKTGAPLAAWNKRILVADARLASAANSPNFAGKLAVARVSNSDKDELVLLDAAGREIQIVAQPNDAQRQTAGKSQTAELVSFAVEGGAPVAVLPMRLNADAISDFVVLRENASVPSIVKSAPARTFVVNSAGDDDVCTDDGGECTLRGAIRRANDQSGADSIIFDIAGGGAQTISPTSDQLPLITDAVTIDATTQPGYAGKPLIEINGANLLGAKTGFGLSASSSTIRGFAITGFTSETDQDTNEVFGGDGIVIFSTYAHPNVSNNLVEANFLGIDRTGGFRAGNETAGVLIYDADANIIGGTTTAARNVISGNQKIVGQYTEVRGVGVSIRAGDNNLIRGNYIGLDASGAFSLGNYQGVELSGKANLLGGNQAGAGNVISGNGSLPDANGRCFGQGVFVTDLIDPDTEELLTDGNVIRGNKIGTNYAGTIGVGNCSTGISTTPTAQTLIGSIAASGRNLVSGNHSDAIWCALGYGGSCTIAGNDVGTDITGTQSIANDRKNGCVGFCIITDTIWVDVEADGFAAVGSPGGTTPGGDCTGLCNLVSGNYNFNSATNPNGADNGGIERTGFGFAAIINNYAGVSRNGQTQLSNFNGVTVFFGDTTIVGDSYTDETGAPVSLGNVLSGNECLGASVSDNFNGTSAAQYFVRANFIGTDAGGSRAIPNSAADGGCTSPGLSITLFASVGIVGGNSAAARNVISGNGYDGLEPRAFDSGAIAVYNNYIGLSEGGAPLGNGRDGIAVGGNTSGLFIGGTGENEANQIKNNARSGVFVSRNPNVETQFVRIVGNSISNNGALGIDLSNVSNYPYAPDGVTVNDCFDEDEGANRLQNYPELFAPVGENGATVIPAVLRSAPAQNFTVDFYANNQIDPTKYGEGEIYIGAATVRTDGNGFVAFRYRLPNNVSSSLKITATATDESGNTSEFSCAAGECTAGGSGFQEAIERAQEGISCVQPIVVNVNTDEADADTADGVCDTDTSAAGSQCSLRAAIQEANARHGYDAINFDIPGGGGVQTINVQTALPPISERVTIDGSTQPGYSDSPVVVVRRGDADVQVGLAIQTSDSYINALAVNGFKIVNILIGSNAGASDNNRVESCFVGTNADGMTVDETRSPANFGIGITLNSKNNRIGGEVAANGNVISAAGVNVALDGAGVSNNRIVNNKIGTNKNGTAKLATPSSQGTGVSLTNGATKNTVGGSLGDGGNLISGHINAGIAFENASGNTVTGNLIGTDANADADIAAAIQNNIGIALGFSSGESGGSNNIIGGAGNLRNVVSGNRTGIFINKFSSGNKIAGNYVGTNKSGLFALANMTNGIYIIGSSNTVGGDANAPNVISGNGETGVTIAPLSANSSGEITGNKISYNIIGADSTGNETLGGFTPTQPQGVVIRGGNAATVENNTVERNTISANTFGVAFGAFSAHNALSNNRIGTNKDGTNAVGNKIGAILLQTSANTISGNVISGNETAGLLIASSLTGVNTGNAKENAALAKSLSAPTDEVPNTENNTVTGNLIGTNADGDGAIGNDGFGVFLGEGALDNRIGGKRSESAGNTISGQASGYGIFLGAVANDLPEDKQPSENVVQGNRVGIQANGEGCLPNKNAIFISEAHDNLIGSDGSDDDDYANFFGCSLEDAILISGADAARNSVRFNFVGTLANGASAANLKNGITVDGAPGSIIEGNTVGNSGGDGIEIKNVGTQIAPPLSGNKNAPREDDALPTVVSGNSVGVFGGVRNAISSAAANQLNGIHIFNSRNVAVGSATLLKNIISANGAAGILIEGENSQNNQINNSIIGTDAFGKLLGNLFDGIKIVDAPNNLIGAAGLGNTIAGNSGSGVSIEGAAATNNQLRANHIGIAGIIGSLNPIKLPNLGSGVKVSEAAQTLVGGLGSGERNYIGGNKGAGIVFSGAAATTNRIINNFIGTDEAGASGFGNGGDGVLITTQSNRNQIGGAQAGSGNKITANGGAGVRIDESAGKDNMVDPNEIFGNAGLGIEIGALGVLPNDAHDADEGANRGQNFPELNYQINGAGELIVNFRVDSAPANSDYGANGIYVEFFKADASGEGALFLGFGYYAASDYNNGAPQYKQINLGNASTLGITAADKITATATDGDGNTSEFTPVIFAPTAALVTVGGKVTTANGRGIRNATVRMTDANGTARVAYTTTLGYYRFDNVAAGETYIFTVKGKRFDFAQPTRVINIDEKTNDVNFIAAPQ